MQSSWFAFFTCRDLGVELWLGCRVQHAHTAVNQGVSECISLIYTGVLVSCVFYYDVCM